MKKRWVVAAVAAAFVAGVLPSLFILSPMPNVRVPPSEARRVRHPDGYSIVFPENMVGVIDWGTPGITSRAESGRSRYYPGLGVRMLDRESLDRVRGNKPYAPGQFQGQPALIYVGPSGKYHRWDALIQRGGHWFEVWLVLHGDASDHPIMPPLDWVPYIDSFEFNPPATRPASAPALVG